MTIKAIDDELAIADQGGPTVTLIPVCPDPKRCQDPFFLFEAVPVERRAITIQGVVQGVGFRPFVYGLASRMELAGFVKNQVGAVEIEAEGEPLVLDDFLASLRTSAPPLARIDTIDWRTCPPRGERCFLIEHSECDRPGPIFVSPDIATCNDCLAELFDPANRRHRHPFINCTNCGPRLTIVTGAPYDRARTTMADFPMCAACQEEFGDAANRRFHAQPTCCPNCGPTLVLEDSAGSPMVGDPILKLADFLRRGRIGALKGLGGYHLACDARASGVVARLRRRKHRDEKPFAVMVADLDAARSLAVVDPAEEALLTSPSRPIVLLKKRGDCPVAEDVAPGNPHLGVMLPYTPIHHLLARELAGIPLVITSGNSTDEPIAYDDDDARRRLAAIADTFLVHDRRIALRCDDSVTRIVNGVELPLRRSRGHAPQAIALPVECSEPILAVGGQYKATFAFGRGRHAFLSHHLGDLDHYEAYQAFVRDVDLFQRLFDIQPSIVVHDRHPDYITTVYAKAREGRLRRDAVQHHHAHIASCMAENGLLGPVIGVAFDGTGFGDDGSIWGGEFLVADLREFRRIAHLRPVRMPGGGQAILEPWRMGVAYGEDSGCDPMRRHVPKRDHDMIMKMLERAVNAPLTSSAGRLFDAAAAILGLRLRIRHEGQAAMELEWLAQTSEPQPPYPLETPVGEPAIDTRPLIRAIVDDVDRSVDRARIARRFHATMAHLIADVCDGIRSSTGLGDVALSGGVFMNALLTTDTTEQLSARGFRVHRHRQVPPNDGGLSLGQLVVAAARSGR